MVIGRSGSAPTIDGKLEPGEWDHAAALTGHINCSPQAERALVIEKQDVTWYITYDDEYLYIAMDNPLRPGTWPRAQAKGYDNRNLLWDDHIEVSISPHGRKKALREGWGFYKVIGNAKGYYSDEHFYNGTPGTEKIWNIGGDYACHVVEGHWQLEMSIALAAMDVETLDGRDLIVQLVRADHSIGAYFAGITAATWKGFNRFFEMRFRPEAPVFRFHDRGKIREGEMDLDFEILGTEEDQPAEILVEAFAPQGKRIFNKMLETKLARGQRTALEIDEPISYEKDSNDYQLHIAAEAGVTHPVTGEPSMQVLYKNRIALAPMTEARYEQYIVPWMERQGEPGKYNWSFRYWPSFGVATSAADLDLFGIAKELRDTVRCQVDVLNSADEVIASDEGPQEDKVYSLQFDTGKLPVGDYTARLRLFSAGGEVVSEKTTNFPVRRYPWEGNRIGLDEVLVPPYEPLVVEPDARTVAPVLRRYTFAPGGLPESIVAGGDAGDEELLTSPIRLEAVQNGEQVPLENASLSFTEARETVVSMQARGRLGGVPCTIASTVEQDGWIDVELELQPGDEPRQFDRLTLVIPTWQGTDTMYVHRLSDGIAAWKNALPEGEGVVWESRRMLPMPTNREYWGSFAPIAYAGNGDKGVWWFAEECRDWQHADDRSAIEYVRTENGVELRINFFAAPVTLDGPRRIHFALLVDPVKAIEDERKRSWKHKRPAGTRLIFGWRWWGVSSDGYYITDEDTRALDDLLHGRDLRPEIPHRTGDRKFYHVERIAKRAARAIEDGGEITLYGSNSNGSLDLPAFDTYYGEWGVPRPDNRPAPEHQRKWNIQGSHQIKRRREHTEHKYNWTQSKIDCFIWYHEKLLRETPVTGTWWDNASSFLITDYDPEREEFYQKFSVFARRQVMKRLNVICIQLDKPMMSWLNNQGADWSWNQQSWHTENGFTVSGDCILEKMTIDQYRSLFRLRRGIVHRGGQGYVGGMPDGSPPERWRMRSRSDLGLALLHDIGGSSHSKFESDFVLGKLDKWVGFWSEKKACPFTGYWRSAEMVEVKTPGVYASVYRGKDRAAVILFNANPDPVKADVRLQPALIDRKIQRAYDGETNRKLFHFWGAWGDYQKGLFEIPSYDFRLLVVE